MGIRRFQFGIEENVLYILNGIQERVEPNEEEDFHYLQEFIKQCNNNHMRLRDCSFSNCSAKFAIRKGNLRMFFLEKMLKEQFKGNIRIYYNVSFDSEDVIANIRIDDATRIRKRDFFQTIINDYAMVDDKDLSMGEKMNIVASYCVNMGWALRSSFFESESKNLEFLFSGCKKIPNKLKKYVVESDAACSSFKCVLKGDEELVTLIYDLYEPKKLSNKINKVKVKCKNFMNPK